MKKRILSIVLSIVMLVSLLPTAAFAAGTDTGKAIQLVDSGTAANIGGGQADSIYFGTYKQSSDGNSGYNVDPIKWRVLSNADGKLFLLSDQNLDVFEYHKEWEAVTWETSTMRSWLNGLAANQGNGDDAIDYAGNNFLDTAFSAEEQAAIADTTVVNDDNPANYETEGGNNTTDKVFLLSIAEASNTSYFADDNSRIATNTAYVAGGGETGADDMCGVGVADYWWLRSPGSGQDDAAGVDDGGDVDVSGFTVSSSNIAVRPAFNLNLNSVLFTSAAAGGKADSTVDGSLTEVGTAGTEWKLTLLDTNRSISVSEQSLTGAPGGTVSISYSGAETGNNEYVSVMLAQGDTILYYGRIAQNSASGTAGVTIPSGLADGTYTLKVFSEQYNGDKRTDYASAFKDISLTVSNNPTETHSHPVCGVANCTDSTHNHSEVTEWVELTASDLSNGTLSLTDGKSYYLGEDITVSASVEISGTVNLCLNGHVLEYVGTGKESVIKVTSDATLSICDCTNTTHTGYINSNGLWKAGTPSGEEAAVTLTGGIITGGKGYRFSDDTSYYRYGGGIYVDGGTLNLYGGNIAGNLCAHEDDLKKYGGGGVYVKNGTFNMYDGTITGNCAMTKTNGGGGLYLDNSTFNMSGGKISQNKAYLVSGSYGGYGGGIYVFGSNSQVNLSGTAEISGNSAYSAGGGINLATGSITMSGNVAIDGNEAQNGGGVSFKGSTFTINGGSISNNTATGSYGAGGVEMTSGSITMNDGSISNNTAAGTGGGVRVYDGTFTMAGGSISGNKTTGSAHGGGVYIYNNGSATFAMTAGKISGNTASGNGGGVYNNRVFQISGGEISGNIASVDGGGVYANRAMKLSGAPTISGNTVNGSGNNVSVSTSVNIAVVGELTNTTPIGVTVRSSGTGKFASPSSDVATLANGYADKFRSDNPAYDVAVEGANLILAEASHSHDMSVACGGSGVTFEPWDGTTTFPGGNVYLTADVTLSSTITISSGTVNLCLNGHKITCSGTTAIVVNSGATLNICDCGSGGSVTNSGSTGSGTTTYGIYNSGTVNVYGGTISATTTATTTTAGSGSGIYNYSGQVTVVGTGAVVSGTLYGIYSTGGTVSVSAGKVSGKYGIYNEGEVIVGTGAVVSGTNCGISNSGTVSISGGTVQATSSSGHGIYSTGGTVSVSGGTVQATSSSGRGIYSTGGTVSVSGGTVQANGNGGRGIYNSGGTVSVSEGTAQATGNNGQGIYSTSGAVSVSNGTVQATGSNGKGIYSTGGTVSISDGSIVKGGSYGRGIENSGGIVTVSGGSVTATGVYNYGIENSSGTLKLSGVPIISGTAAGIYLAADQTITISGALTYAEENAISVKMDSAGTFTSGWTEKMGDAAANYGSYFTSANDGYTVQPDGNELKLAVPALTGVSAEGYSGSYDGNAHGITVTVPDGATVEYGTTEGEYTAAASPTYTDAGSYTVYYKATMNGFEPVIGSAVVSISKAPLTVTAKNHTITYGDAPANDGVNYDGFVNNETASVLGGTLDFTYSYAQYGNVGNSYTITPKGLTSDNYAITFTPGTLTVQPKEIGIEWGNTDLTYSGEAQAPTATATGMVNEDDVTLTVSGEQTNVGTHTATVSAISNSNYKLPDAVTTQFTIAKAQPTYTMPANLTATYGQTLANVSLPSGWTWKNASASVGNVGINSFKAVFTPDDTNNYNVVTVDVPVTVNKAAPSYTAPTGLTATYGQTLANVTLPVGWTWKDTTTSVGNVGENSFKAVFTPDDTNNYNTVELDVTVMVGKADASYTTPTGLTATYGDTLEDVSLPSGWTWKDTTTSVGNVGENSFKAVFTPDDTNNYNTVELDVTVMVGKANSSYTAPTAKELVYNGSAQPLVNAGSTTTGAMQYALGSTTEPTGSWSATLPQGQNAGTYYVWYKVVGDDNHNDVAPACVAVTIAKKQIAKPAADNSTFTYNGNDQTYALNGDPAFSIDNNVQKNAGSYTVTATLRDTANYEWADGTTAVLEYTFKIEQKELGIAWSNTTLTYNGAAQQPTATATGVVAGEQIALVLGAPATNAGSYTATVHSIDGATAQNYKLPTNKSTSFTIEQQALTIVWGNSNFTYDGAEKFPAFNVEGIWNEDDVQVTKEGAQTNAGEYTAQIIGLTGTAADNYKLTGTLTKDFVINKADQAAPAVNKADETISGKNDGKITDVTANMEYRAEGEDCYTAITGETVENLADGKYYVRVKGDSNHNPSADTAVMIGAGRMLTVTVPQNQVGYTMTVDKSTATYGEAVKVTFALNDGYSAADGFAVKVNGSAVTLSSGEYTVTSATEDIALTVEGVADITAPAGEVNIQNNKWTSFLSDVTFGLFFNKTQDVTITAADTGSGMNSIQYYLAGRALELDEVKQITDWQDYNGTFQIDPDNAYVVYVKVTDNAGNVSYLNSDGVVLDQTVPVLVGIENNGSYYGDQCFKALDDYLDALKVDGVDVTDEMNADNEYTIVADNAEHIVTATDKAGNATEYKITVFKNYTVTYKVDGNTVSTQTVGHGKDATAPTIPKKVGYTQTAPEWDGDGTNITADTVINAVYTINTYTVTYVIDGEVVDTQTVEHGTKIAEPTAPTKDKANFAGWFSDIGCTMVWNFDNDTVTGDLTLYAKWSEVTVFQISGTVKQLTGNSNETTAVRGATVKLMLGDKLIATTTTDGNGNYSFAKQEAGHYNVVVTNGAQTVTVLIELTKDTANEVVLPASVTNSIVDHKPAGNGKNSIAAGTLVGNLDKVAAAVRDDYLSAQKVEVKLTVADQTPVVGTPVAGSDAAKQQAQQKAIQQKAPGKQMVFFDLSVMQSVTDAEGKEESSAITNTGETLLEIRIPFETGNKWGITIYRYHDNKAEALPKVNEGSQTEGFWVGDDGYIHIYTHKFSTYAVGYTVPSYGYFVPVTPDTVTSAQTFDAGIMAYVTMSMLAATGSAVVIGKKRKEEN